MIMLQRENVVRIVDSTEKAEKLKEDGFKEVNLAETSVEDTSNEEEAKNAEEPPKSKKGSNKGEKDGNTRNDPNKDHTGGTEE